MLVRTHQCIVSVWLGWSAGKIAEDPGNCAAIAREVGAIQQLILMALSEHEAVVEQACKTIGTRLAIVLALLEFQGKIL